MSTRFFEAEVVASGEFILFLAPPQERKADADTQVSSWQNEMQNTSHAFLAGSISWAHPPLISLLFPLIRLIS